MQNFTIIKKLNETSSFFSDQVAIEHEGVYLTWSELQLRVNCIAEGFKKIGIKKHDNVAIWSHNSINFIVAFYALTKIGAVAVLINVNWSEHEVVNALERMDVSCLLFDTGFHKMNFIEICNNQITLLNGVECKFDKLPRLKKIIYIGKKETRFMNLDDIAVNEYPSEITEEIDCQDTATIIFTSGTTSMPKGVMLSNKSLLINAAITSKSLMANENDRFCVVLPMFHCFSLVANMLTALICGGTLMIPSVDEYKGLVKFIEKKRCTIFHAVPTLLIRQMDRNNVENYNLSNLRTGIIGGAMYSKKQYMDFCLKFQYDSLLSSLGQTEATAAITMVDYFAPLEAKATTVGRFIEVMEGAIIDPVTNQELETGRVGEICVKGPCIMQGYYGQDELTKEVIDRDGWLHTGDLGMIDASGNIHLAGRLKEIIIRGGENISLNEVELAIAKNSKVSDVKAIGIPDPVLGEIICACVVAQKGERITKEEIISEAAKTLAIFKLPDHLIFMDSIPRSVTGKVSLGQLTEKVLKILMVMNKKA